MSKLCDEHCRSHQRFVDCPSHQRYLEADTARLLYKNRLQEVRKNLALQKITALSLADAMKRLTASVDGCIAATKQLEKATANLSDDEGAADAKQG